MTRFTGVPTMVYYPSTRLPVGLVVAATGTSVSDAKAGVAVPRAERRNSSWLECCIRERRDDSALEKESAFSDSAVKLAGL